MLYLEDETNIIKFNNRVEKLKISKDLLEMEFFENKKYVEIKLEIDKII